MAKNLMIVIILLMICYKNYLLLFLKNNSNKFKIYYKLWNLLLKLNMISSILKNKKKLIKN